MNTVCLIDVQGFQFKSKLFLCKELAIKPLIHCCHDIKKYIFNFPIDYSNLHSTAKSQIRYLMNNIHGHFWHSEDDSPHLHLYSDLGKILSDEIINNNYKIILVKGRQKVEWLINVLNEPTVKVINIEDFDCPSIGMLKQGFDSQHCKPVCEMHYISGKTCAVENVQLMNNWLLEYNVVPSIIEESYINS